MAKKRHKQTSKDLPGSLYQRNGRWWWKVQLPGEEKTKARPLKPIGSRYATTDYAVAAECAKQLLAEHLFQKDIPLQGDVQIIPDLVRAYMTFAKEYYVGPKRVNASCRSPNSMSVRFAKHHNWHEPGYLSNRLKLRLVFREPVLAATNQLLAKERDGLAEQKLDSGLAPRLETQQRISKRKEVGPDDLFFWLSVNELEDIIKPTVHPKTLQEEFTP
jgi:DNA polymerase III delta prime subunit